MTQKLENTLNDHGFLNPFFKENLPEKNLPEENIETITLLDYNLKYKNKMYYNIISFISFLFFFPIGTYTIYCNYKARKLYRQNLNQKAGHLIEKAYYLSIVGIIMGILIYSTIFLIFKM